MSSTDPPPDATALTPASHEEDSAVASHAAAASSSPPPPLRAATHARTPSRIPVPVHARAGSGLQAAAASPAASTATLAAAAVVAAPANARPKPVGATVARTKRPEPAASASASTSASSAPSAAPASVASVAHSASGPAAPPAAVSASARHAAYLANLVSARAAREREERRRKPPIKDRLTSTFTMSAQKHAVGGASGADSSSNGAAAASSSSASSATPPLDRLSAAKDAEYAALMPRVFSMLGGNSIDCLRRAFHEAGWVENPSERSGVWAIQWSIVGRVIDYTALAPQQIVNHFERAHCITSKIGLCHSIVEGARNHAASSAEFFPRCFELHKHEAPLLAEFRTAFLEGVALNYAGRFVRSYEKQMGIESENSVADADEEAETEALPPLSSFDPALVQLSFVAFQALLRSRRFEVDGLDNALPVRPPPPLPSSSSSAKAKASAVSDGVEYSQLSDAEWIALETEVERLEQIDRDADAAKQRAKRKAAAEAASASAAATSSGSESKSNDDDSSSFPAEDAAAGDDQADAQEDQEELDAELDSFEEAAAATSPPAAPAEAAEEDASPSAAAEASFPDADESPSLSSLSLLSRAPLEYCVLHSHFLLLFQELRGCDPQHFSLVAPHTRNLWILKPGGLSRGRGIEVHACYASLLATLQKGGSFVAQQYIERPLLVHAKKFDIRQWVLVTNFASTLTVWFYSANCYARFSSKDYTPFVTGASASSIHLTNNSIQKHESDFDSLGWAKGNMWSSAQLQTHLEAMIPSIHKSVPTTRERGLNSGVSVWEKHIQPAMKRIAALTIAAGFQAGLEPRPNSFSLYGFDYMISRDLKPWLIEVNSSPTLVGISVPGIVEAMSKDLVSIITQDPYSPASDEWRATIAAEKARLAALALAEEQAREAELEGEEKQQPNSSAATKGATAGASGRKVAVAAAGVSAAKPGGLNRKPSSVKRAGSASAASSSSAAAAASSAATAAASASSSSTVDPFVLPVPHLVGHRVGGFEVVDSVYIGCVPRSHRTPLAAAGAEKIAAVDGAAAGKSTKKDGAAAERDGKKAPAQPTGLFVTGKSIPNPSLPAAAPAGPASKLARAGSSSTLRRVPSATSASASAANAKAKPARG